jgi:hypothetical protein
MSKTILIGSYRNAKTQLIARNRVSGQDRLTLSNHPLAYGREMPSRRESIIKRSCQGRVVSMAAGRGRRHANGSPASRTVLTGISALAFVCGGFACTATSQNVPNVPTGAEGGIQPVVTAISPSAGTGGEPVVITGRALGGVTVVCFGGVPGSDLRFSANGQIMVRSPSGSGKVRVTVIAPRSRSVVIPAGQFTYLRSTAPDSSSSPASSQCPASWSPDPSA